MRGRQIPEEGPGPRAVAGQDHPAVEPASATPLALVLVVLPIFVGEHDLLADAVQLRDPDESAWPSPIDTAWVTVPCRPCPTLLAS